MYDIICTQYETYLNVKQRIKQMNQNLTEDRLEEKAIPTRKANMYFNNLVRTNTNSNTELAT